MATYSFTKQSSPAEANICGLVGCQAIQLTALGAWASNSMTCVPEYRFHIRICESTTISTLSS